MRIYINKIENRITFKVRAGCYLKLLVLETMKLHKITRDKNGEKVPHLDITEVVWVLCNILNNDYQQGSRVLYTFISNKLLNQLLNISPKLLHF